MVVDFCFRNVLILLILFNIGSLMRSISARNSLFWPQFSTYFRDPVIYVIFDKDLQEESV